MKVSGGASWEPVNCEPCLIFTLHLTGICSVHPIGLTDLDNATGENKELLSANESTAAGRSLRYF